MIICILSEDNLWSVLYLTGYLTKVRKEEYLEVIPEGMTALMIPNKEIKEIFEATIIKWFDDSAEPGIERNYLMRSGLEK